MIDHGNVDHPPESEMGGEPTEQDRADAAKLIRLARLEVVKQSNPDTGESEYVHLIASNGETLMHGEMLVDGERGRAAVIRAMREIVATEDAKDRIRGAVQPQRGW